MEEKVQETTKNAQEEIKRLTFDPQEMLDQIYILKESLHNAIIEKNVLNMLVTDLELELKKAQKKSIKGLMQEILLRLLGGQWEEDK